MIKTIYDLPTEKVLNLEKLEYGKIGEAAQTCFIRAQRFIGGYCVEKEIEELCKSFFANTNVNQKNGLVKQYKKLKEKVIEENKLGLILIGANVENNILIDEYPTINNNIIDLTINSISRVLLREYFTSKEIELYCRKTPNFDIYYKG